MKTIGLSELNDETKGVTYLIHDATTTLYEAKRQGNKNSVNY